MSQKAEPTCDEIKSFVRVLAYLEESERPHYEENPTDCHIWIDIEAVKRMAQRLNLLKRNHDEA